MIESLRALFERGVSAGHHFGAQIYVSRKGDVLVDDAFGISVLDDPAAESPSGRPASRDDWWLWLSASKPVGAVAAAQLWERGLLDLDAPVAEWIPEFGQGGKDGITMRHILTHTAGFPNADEPVQGKSAEEALAIVCETPLQEGWTVGETAGYHVRASWLVLGEMLQRVDGRSFAEYVRAEIFEPLGMPNCWIGMPDSIYREHLERIVPSYFTAKGKRIDIVRHRPEQVLSARPASNGRGPIRELARFYEGLLNGGELDGHRILRAETVAEFTRPHRVGKMDTTFRHRMDWGLGFILDSKRYGLQTVPYGYGDLASPSTFGHGGHMSTTAFADPAHGLVVAVAFNGLPGHPRHNKRVRDFCTAIYQEVRVR